MGNPGRAPTSGAFKPGNQVARGADHSGRKFLTQRLISQLNENFQGMKREARPVKDKDGKPRNGSDGKPIMEIVWVKDGKPQDITRADKLIDQLIFNATVLGDQTAIRDIFNRLEGMPVQALTGADGAPLEATHFTVQFNVGRPEGANPVPAHHAMVKDTTGRGPVIEHVASPVKRPDGK